MGLLLGTRDLGIEVNWRFGFVGHGTKAVSAPGVVYVDVGGRLEPGVLDHHQGDNAAGDYSAAEVVFHHSDLVYNHLLGGLLRIHRDEGSVRPTPRQFTIITHFDPDWDAVTACWLVMRLIEDGGFPRFVPGLAAYAREVDQGRYVLRTSDPVALEAPHLGYLALQNPKDAVGQPSISSEEQLRLGLALIDRWVADLAAAQSNVRGPINFRAGAPGGGKWREDPRFAAAVDLLKGEVEAFNADVARAKMIPGVLLPAADGGPSISVPAFVAGAPTAAALNKYWARAAGYPLFICPTPLPDEAPTSALPPAREFSRVIISVDPTFHVDGRRPNLRGLGRALELEEARQRQQRNRGTDDRGGEPRFPGGYCQNADPWYDGRGHDFTIVDAPRVGTVLDYSELVRITTQTHFWETTLAESVVVMVWADQPGDGETGCGRALAPFEGMTATLKRLYDDSREKAGHLCKISAPAEIGIAQWIRIFPDGMAAPIGIVELKAIPGATLEQLVECYESLLHTMANGPPDYTFARIRLTGYVADQGAADRSLRQLAGGELTELELDAAHSDLVLFNGRSLVFRERGNRAITASPDADLEMLLYAAFLNESLIAFSRRLGGVLPEAGAALDKIETGQLRGDLLRFQAKYYKLEVSRHPRGRRLYGQLYKSLRVGEQYAEVLAAAERLGELEDHIAEEREARAGWAMEVGVYFVGVLEAIHTVIVFVEMGPEAKHSGLFETLSGATVLIALLALAIIWWYRKPRRPRRTDDRATPEIASE